MKIFNTILILLLLSIIGLNAQEKHIFSEKAKTAFKKIATPESTLRWMTIKETEKVPKAEFLQKSKVFFDLNEKTAFKEIRVNEDKNGWLHYRLQQTHNDIPIFGAEYLVHEKNGLVETANGDVATGLNISTTPSISEEVALQMLLNEIGAEKYAWESESLEKMIKHQTQVRTNCNSPQRRIQKEDQNATYFPKGELIIASANGDFNPENFTLGYKFRIKTVQPLSHFDYIVDAFTGSVVYKNSLLCQYDVQGTCVTHRYGTQEITTDFDGVQYSLKDSSRNIETYNGQGLNSNNVGAIDYFDSNNIWDNPNHRSACEAHWVLEETHDYFENNHDWNGHDGNGSKLSAWVNVGSNWNNAVGGGGEIYLGEGDGITKGPFTAIDIVAHEFTHSVIQACGANLQYIRESGALNESFADIFGTLVEFYAEPNENDKDWLLGEDFSLIGSAGVTRDMSDPRSKGHPAAYKDDNWYDTTSGCNILNDFCGVHTNSSVQNHWFYILANGKTGTNFFGYDYDVTGIGRTTAAQLAFYNLNNYLVPYSDYMDARNGSLEATDALGFSRNQVEEAWCAVGLGDCGNSTTGTITVTSPNGGESLNQGVPYTITWNRTGNIGATVTIECSINAGNEWHLITSNAANNGSYTWYPSNVETNQALIRVSSNSNETIFGISDDCFSIEPGNGIDNCGIEASFDVSDQYPCPNETVIFTSTSTGSGANTYRWYVNGIYSYTGTVFNYNFSQTGNYEIELRATVGNTCGDMKIMNVYVQPSANADFTYNAVDGNTLFTAPDNAIGATYFWTTTEHAYTYETPNFVSTHYYAGIYEVCLTVNSDCSSDTVCKNIQTNVLGCTDPTACNYDPHANVESAEFESCIYGNCHNCLETDSLALVALYNATNGPNWTTTWDLSQPVGTWYGITTKGCHVHIIDLESNNLSGVIPAAIGDLEYLAMLELSNNNLSGTIPKEIGKSPKLERLYITNNNLSGVIPKEIGNLQNLNGLGLNNNGLTGEIPSEIGNIQGLSYLDLYNNNLSGAIPKEIGNLQELVNLPIGNNNLSGAIPKELGNLRILENMWLGFGNLSGEIPKELGNLERLITLGLGDNNLSGKIPKELGNLNSLKYLYLFDNNLSGEIPSEIGNLQNLMIMKLYDNNLSGCYPSSLCNLSISISSPDNFTCTGNPDLPDNGSDQGFIDFCNGTSPCNIIITEVYPGDLNFDGVANYKDILSFGLYHGEYGFERETVYQNINWSAHPSSDWGVNQENGTDLKHIDADGNGVIDLNDIVAINVNYGNTHNASSIPISINNNTNSPFEVSLVVSNIPSFIGNDDKLVLDILLEDVLGSELALYGGYFSIAYEDLSSVINDIDVEFPQSWFGTPNQDFEYIFHNDNGDKRIDIGFTKVNHQNSIGEGIVGQLIVQIDDNFSSEAITLGFSVSNTNMQNSEAFLLPFESNSALINIDIPEPTACESSIYITPNTPLSHHAAQGLIWTTGNISINNSQDITFGSARLKINDGFYVENGGEFTYYNDPCGTTNRDVKTSINVNTKNEAFKNLKSYNYQIDEGNLIYNFELNASDKVAIEIVDRNGERTKHSFGIKQSGQNQITLPSEKLPDGEFMTCLKIGLNRYYSQSGHQ